MNETSRIVHVDLLDCIIEPYRWGYAEENTALIDARWTEAAAQKPKMFNGRVLLTHSAEVEERDGTRVFAARFFETDYKNLYVTQQLGFPDRNVQNCFAMAVLRAADGAYLLGEMGPHTAHAGTIYSPSGTPDVGDISGDRVDLAGSVLRELEEETGLTSADVRPASGCIVIFCGQQAACMQILELSDDAATVERRIADWLATQDQPELARMHIIRTRADLKPERMPPFMTAFMEYLLPGL